MICMKHTGANGRFTAIVVGKKVFTLILTACSVVIAVLIMLFVFKNINLCNTDIHKKTVQGAYPAVCTGERVDSIANIISGLYFLRKIACLLTSVFPI